MALIANERTDFIIIHDALLTITLNISISKKLFKEHRWHEPLLSGIGLPLCLKTGQLTVVSTNIVVPCLKRVPIELGDIPALKSIMLQHFSWAHANFTSIFAFELDFLDFI